jgi:hypothetical protein
MHAFFHSPSAPQLPVNRIQLADIRAPREIAPRSVTLDAIAFRGAEHPVNLSCHITRGGRSEHFGVELGYPAFQALLREHLDRAPAIKILESLGKRKRYRQALPGASEWDKSPITKTHAPFILMRIERLIGRPAVLRTTSLIHAA